MNWNEWISDCRMVLWRVRPEMCMEGLGKYPNRFWKYSVSCIISIEIAINQWQLRWQVKTTVMSRWSQRNVLPWWRHCDRQTTSISGSLISFNLYSFNLYSFNLYLHVACLQREYGECRNGIIVTSYVIMTSHGIDFKFLNLLYQYSYLDIIHLWGQMSLV